MSGIVVPPPMRARLLLNAADSLQAAIDRFERMQDEADSHAPEAAEDVAKEAADFVKQVRHHLTHPEGATP